MSFRGSVTVVLVSEKKKIMITKKNGKIIDLILTLYYEWSAIKIVSGEPCK